MKTIPTICFSLVSVGAVCVLTACSDPAGDTSNTKPVVPDYEPDTSYLDDLGEENGIDPDEGASEEQPIEIDQTAVVDETHEPIDEEREWTQEEGSKSIFGRSRDKAKNLRDQIQDGTQPENGIANTTYDEEYAQAAGHAWDMPEGWRMAVPSAGHFAEMYIQNPLGNASVVFEKTQDSFVAVRRSLESNITSTFGDSKARTSTKEIKGFKVTMIDLEGTYLDPTSKGGRNESPFYAIHAAYIELPTTKIVIRMWGPQETVNQSKARFDAMLEKMYEK